MEPIVLPRFSDQKPLVSVVLITYNHEPYIRDCLEGCLMQKTDFPIEIIIHDDASTDHTADIIREYYEKRPDLFRVIIDKENQYSKGVALEISLFEQTQGKYIALCEGDDYWTDPFKLQKQFNFMELNSEYSCCFHNFKISSSKKNKLKLNNNRYRTKREICLEESIKNGPDDIRFCTFFFKKSALKDYLQIRKNCSVGDYPLQIALSKTGNMFYLDETMSVYRENSDGSWSVSTNNKTLKCNHIQKCIEWLNSLRVILNNDQSIDVAIGRYLYQYSLVSEDFEKYKNSVLLHSFIQEQSFAFFIKYSLYRMFPFAHRFYVYLKSKMR